MGTITVYCREHMNNYDVNLASLHTESNVIESIPIIIGAFTSKRTN